MHARCIIWPTVSVCADQALCNISVPPLFTPLSPHLHLPFSQMNWPTISVPTITRRKRKWLYRPLGMLLILFPIGLLASLLSQVRQGPTQYALWPI